MSVIITNITPPKYLYGHIHDYTVRINDGQPLVVFSHIREDGLAWCLRRAADAIENVGKQMTPDEEPKP